MQADVSFRLSYELRLERGSQRFALQKLNRVQFKHAVNRRQVSATPPHPLHAIPNHVVGAGFTSVVNDIVFGINPTTTVVEEPSNPSANISEESTTSRAIVIGAGLAGLSAAEALSSVFGEVVVLERDSVVQQSSEAKPVAASTRQGVPQFFQPHVLLMRGFQELDQLLPGFEADLVAAGGVSGDWGPTWHIYDYGDLIAPGEPGAVASVSATRATIEKVVRERVLQNTKVSLVGGAFTSGLVYSEDKRAVIGVRIKDGKEIRGALVVDASGRSSSAPQWLAEAGYNEPSMVRIDAKLGYASRLYEVPEELLQRPDGTKVTLIMSGCHPHGTRAACCIVVDNNMWQVLMAGYGGDHPPADEEGYLEFMRSLPDPMAYNVFSKSKPLTPVSRYLNTASQWKQYDKVPLPDHLCLLGDAVCCFNPVYGQGMTVGLLGAKLLRDVLLTRLGGSTLTKDGAQAALQGITKEFQTKLAKVLVVPWAMASGEDLRYADPATSPKPMPGTKFLRSYMALVNQLAHADKWVSGTYWRVVHMVEPPHALFQPAMLLKVVWLLLGKAVNALRQAMLLLVGKAHLQQAVREVVPQQQPGAA